MLIGHIALETSTDEPNRTARDGALALPNAVLNILNPAARQCLNGTVWSSAGCEPLTGDASVRKYFRLRRENLTAILMDASAIPETIAAFIQVGQHLLQLGFSAPEILVQDSANGFLVLEDFGDDTFARLARPPVRSAAAFRAGD